MEEQEVTIPLPLTMASLCSKPVRFGSLRSNFSVTSPETCLYLGILNLEKTAEGIYQKGMRLELNYYILNNTFFG